MSIFLFISLLIGSIVFLFTLWKGLREDYKINSIFTFGFSVLFFVFAGLFLSSVINRGIWLWAAVLGMCFGLLLGVAKTGIRLLDAVESGVLSLLFLMECAMTGLFLSLYSPSTFAAGVFVLWLILLYYYLKTRYKSLSWYKSGKIGFSALSVLIVFFVTRIPVALFFPNMISFLGKIDVLPSFLVSLLLVVCLIRLSRH
ncbi:MAG: hypothetical protein ACD_52C00020G0003 [uncultured bacterium]|uniref:Uncharacterized protein n=1 Tax=Candidatus Woesebacteria bacterium RIFCSPHIGHO2_12_FULL_41_24 TaxID=1802510 RepID=A0A1F8ASK0_9BACT|nr:MAG: hypothetical protein ACD_52C00020G0003 [uncultured bacterium]OGM13399.1 MAG: hypothetical protein A2W15_05885 [Candidatus Woesebacteria bacterium RBG_16_41_13]OGM30499.1 MAG: hypothetical protein A2873_02640 [Candidatus Woesebacteria bacterium RIFCSPHIGHO2_01_FULL_42_80]OGM35943.1 MAG: hypothetical protein A3D84_01675 [Candidatus Woesebacteria bacterium RIFCSPHIGHO2_02_FULL_42_20]OGM54165.1 MAG: hypothetical protein A3E44_00585 [Candidatus Woesebacteria bacterium RIFCSPHIGHO2_12_FULL_41